MCFGRLKRSKNSLTLIHPPSQCQQLVSEQVLHKPTLQLEGIGGEVCKVQQEWGALARRRLLLIMETKNEKPFTEYRLCFMGNG